MSYLLDVNVLVALFDARHVNHDAAHHWFGTTFAADWATCSITETGCVKVRAAAQPDFRRIDRAPRGSGRRRLAAQRMSQSSVCGPDRYSTRPSPCTIVSSSRRMATGCPPHSGTGAVTENSSEIHSPARSGNRGWAP